MGLTVFHDTSGQDRPYSGQAFQFLTPGGIDINTEHRTAAFHDILQDDPGRKSFMAIMQHNPGPDDQAQAEQNSFFLFRQKRHKAIDGMTWRRVCPGKSLTEDDIYEPVGDDDELLDGMLLDKGLDFFIRENNFFEPAFGSIGLNVHPPA